MDLLTHLVAALVYAAVGVGVLGLGYVALDALTPGHLGTHIWTRRSANAAIVLASGMIGLGLVVFAAIWFNGSASLGTALGWSVAFGLLGVGLQAAAFRLLDLVTPGDLAHLVTEREFHPASAVAAAVQLAVSLVVVAAIA